MTLADLKVGQREKIKSVVGDRVLVHQLEALGFVPGSLVSLVSRGPFRDPLAFQIRGTTIALRKSEARCIVV